MMVLGLVAMGQSSGPPALLAAASRDLEARNEQCSALVQLPAPVQLMALSHLSLVQLQRARGVSRHFKRWATEALEQLPRLVSVGGAREDPIRLKGVAGAEVEALSLATMRWVAVSGGRPPPALSLRLPAPRSDHAMVAFADGRLAVVGGWNCGGADPMLQLQREALQWVPGSAAWAALPDLAVPRSGAAGVALPDGRLLVAGGAAGATFHASAEVLTADGSGWVAAAPMSGRRAFAAAGLLLLLPRGRVIVAGGLSANDPSTALSTAELWDPAEDRWSALPPMAHARAGAAACVLADGRFAVVGGMAADARRRRDGEVYDPTAGRWEPLGGAGMPSGRAGHAVVCVGGGMVAVGGDDEGAVSSATLFDEESGRWLALPFGLAVPRDGCARVAPVPSSALALHTACSTAA